MGAKLSRMAIASCCLDIEKMIDRRRYANWGRKCERGYMAQKEKEKKDGKASFYDYIQLAVY